MNALTQYIELFKAHRSTIEANAPAALNERRTEALDVLEKCGRLPQRGDEGYEITSLNDMFAPDYGINIARIKFPDDELSTFRCELPSVTRAWSMLVNDHFVAAPGLEQSLPEGVEVMSLRRAAELYPGMIYGDKLPVDNPVVALNTLFVQDGVFIRIRRGVHFDTPIQILNVFNSATPMLAARRIRVVVEEGAHASVLICEHPRVADVDYLSCRVVDVTVARDAQLDFYDLEEATARSRRASVFACDQHQESRLNMSNIFLDGGMTRNDYCIRYSGDHATTRLGGLVIGGREQSIDNSVDIAHSTQHCSSNQLFKYALFDQSKGAFGGMVNVEAGARYTDARQSNRNLLASPEARMHAMPQLIINCDEVKASHGATTGQLDERALFYMRSRGIPEAEARMMLINAFMTDVLDHVQLEPLRERLRHLVDKRLRGCNSTCNTCSLEKLK